MTDLRISEIPPIASIETAQRLLGDAGRTAIFELMRRGELDRVKLGRSTKISGESLRRYIGKLARTDAGRAA
jgi:hypothetical protein